MEGRDSREVETVNLINLRTVNFTKYSTNKSQHFFCIVVGGYEKGDPPVLDGENPCEHCHLSPCIVATPPSWLRGSAVANLGNLCKRFKMYRKFWTLLSVLGVWKHPLYILHKNTKTTAQDRRDVMPTCVLRVSFKYFCTYIANTIHFVSPGGAWAVSEPTRSSVHRL